MYRDELDERDDHLRQRMLAMLEQKHYVVADGRVVRHPDTDEPLENSEAILKIMDRLMKLDDRFAFAHALDEEADALAALPSLTSTAVPAAWVTFFALAQMMARRNDLESSAIVQALLAGVAAVPGITPEQRRVMLEAAAAELQRSQDPETIPGEIVRGDGT